MKVLLWMNKHRANSKGEAPIMLRVTHQGKRVNVTTDIRLKLDQWDSKKQKARGASEFSREVNSLFSTQRSSCIRAVEQLLSEGKPFSTHDVVAAIKGSKKVEVGWLEMYDIHLAHMESRVGVDYAKATVVRYKSSRKNLRIFILQKLKKKDLHLSRVDRKVVSDLDQFLRGELKFSNNYVIKTMEQVRKVFKKGVLHGYVDHNPFDLMSYKKTETTKDYLYHDELNLLIDWQPNDERLSITKDIFLFMCYTGLAHSDAHKASMTDITIDTQERPWIILRRTKNNNLVQVPLLKIAAEIIKKYEGFDVRVKKGLLLPVPCNQVLNRNLKDLAKAVGFNKNICSHSGRYTFASTVLLGNGVPVEVAQKLLAHNSIKSTMLYSKLSAHAIVGEVSALEKKL